MSQTATFFDRVTLSPRLWREDRQRLEGVLTHELSHEHFAGNLSEIGYLRIPVWFTEGVAVMASDGGGGDRVSEHEAHRAICEKRAIEPTDEPGLFANISMKAPSEKYEGEPILLRMHLAYRQAEMFVSYLRHTNAGALEEMLNRIYAGEAFKAAFEASYRKSAAQMWQNFVKSCPST